jgi:hypothetical protein
LRCGCNAMLLRPTQKVVKGCDRIVNAGVLHRGPRSKLLGPVKESLDGAEIT